MNSQGKTMDTYTLLILRPKGKRTTFVVVDSKKVEHFRSYKREKAQERQRELNAEWRPIAA
jgi:hypothetical protein